MATDHVGIHSPEQVQALYESDSATAINEYLSLMEESETPRQYLIWSLIAAAGALIGKNGVFQSGPHHTIRSNMFVILVGPSAIRKSSAISMTESMLQSSTLNFGPTDTGGQRHGLMSALTGLYRTEKHKLTLDAPFHPRMVNPRPPSDMFLVSSEFGRLLGQGSLDMANFLVDLYDGVEIDYQTKAGETRLQGPLASILAGTTPSSLANILPENAVTHGIISRFIFIYEEELYKTVPLPPEPTEEWFDSKIRFQQRLDWIDSNRQNFHLTPEARKSYAEALYHYSPALEDPRLESYRGRRSSTLLKVAMAIAALRCDNTIIDSDLRLAHELLAAAEPKMHRALEYFGRNRVYQGRMLMIQFLKSAGRGATASRTELMAAAASELNAKEAAEAIDTMLKNGELFSYGNDDSIIMLGTLKNEFLKGKK